MLALASYPQEAIPILPNSIIFYISLASLVKLKDFDDRNENWRIFLFFFRKLYKLYYSNKLNTLRRFSNALSLNQFNHLNAKKLHILNRLYIFRD